MKSPDTDVGEAVWDLVAEFLEEREQDQSVSLEEFVRRHPDHADELRSCLASFQWMEQTAAREREIEVFPHEFGNYTLLRVIGRGGMGTVYEAIHRPLRRHVAVKVMPPHLTHLREFRIRFLREARVVASLHHTNIAPVFEVGQIGSALYLAMPYIDGPNLRELWNLKKENLPERAFRPPRLFTPAYFRWVAKVGVEVAQALDHAHRRGVVHRDIKPSNLLIDDSGTTWVVDFGLAKTKQHPSVTQPGELIGTLRYASPEQLRNEPLDRRSDLYSLGVTLYELATRKPAFPEDGQRDLRRPQPLRPRQIVNRIPEDLETIILRAVEPEPADRYRSGQALFSDLQRFLNDEPISAKRIGLLGRVTRWCRRNPALSLVVVFWLFTVASGLLLYRHHLISKNQELERLVKISNQRNFDLLLEKAERFIDSGEPDKAQRLVEQAAEIQFSSRIWHILVKAIDHESLPRPDRFPSGGKQLIGVSLTGDSNVLALSEDGELLFWKTDLDQAERLSEFPQGIDFMQRVGKNRFLIRTHSGWSFSELQSGKLTRTGSALPDLSPLRFSPSGTWAVESKPSLRLRNLVDSDQYTPIELGAAPIQDIGWSRDERRVVIARVDSQQLEIWDISDRSHTTRDFQKNLNPSRVTAVAFHPNEDQVACGCFDGSIHFVGLPALESQMVSGSGLPINRLQFDRDGRLLLVQDPQGLRLWDVAYESPRFDVTATRSGMGNFDFSGELGLIAIVDKSGQARLVRIPPDSSHRTLGPQRGTITALESSRNNRWLVWGTHNGQVRAGSPLQGVRSETVGIPLLLRDLKFSTSAKIAGCGDGNPPILLLSADNLKPVGIGAGTPAARSLAFVKGRSAHLVTAHVDEILRVWNLSDGELYTSLKTDNIMTLAASPDGSVLLGGTDSGDLYMWNTTTFQQRRISRGHRDRIWRISFSRDGQEAVTGGEDGKICGWSLPNMTLDYVIEGPGRPIRDVSFCLDETTLATCSGDSEVVLWSIRLADRVATLKGRFGKRFNRLATCQDGDWLIASGVFNRFDSAIEQWDLRKIYDRLVDSGLPVWTDGQQKRPAVQSTADQNRE